MVRGVSEDGPREERGHNFSFPLRVSPELRINIAPLKDGGRRECLRKVSCLSCTIGNTRGRLFWDG